MKYRGHKNSLLKKTLGLAGLAIITMLFVGVGAATPGDLLATVTVPVPSTSCCGIGIDYDGTDILYTNYLDPTIYKTNLTGANLGSVVLINPDNTQFTDGLNAIAYNFNDGMLYGGGWGSTNLYKTDLSTGITTLVKANAVAPVFNFIDGLAWDPTDNTFWMSDDVVCDVEHLDVFGNDIGGFDGCVVTGLKNSGLAVSLNGNLWYGTNGAGQIYLLDTSTDPPTNAGLFASPGGRDEDMVCGPKFTKSDGTSVETLLSKDTYDNTFAVIEVADETCTSPAVPEITLTPPEAKNPAGTSHIVTANVTAGGIPVPGVLVSFEVIAGPNIGQVSDPNTGECTVNDDCTTDLNGQVSWTYTSNGAVGTDTIVASFTDENGEVHRVKVLKEWFDGTPPECDCMETVNPAGKNVPPAGSTTLPGSKGGQNEDGFYELRARDNVDPSPDIYVLDDGSGTIFGPFDSGTKIKYTQAPGATPNQKVIGGPNSAVALHIKGNGDAVVFAVDAAGNTSPLVFCLVPPPPK